ncbi:MAG: hypothetical protein LBD23_11765, partial [Oscillospiraceae bacterium]|nr:hypothetical protein [Oscillospiraceae bacterium]
EYEANVFAADILLDDDEVFDLMKKGYDESQVARWLGVNINLLLIKLHEMNKRGFEFRLSREAGGVF